MNRRWSKEEDRLLRDTVASLETAPDGLMISGWLDVCAERTGRSVTACRQRLARLSGGMMGMMTLPQGKGRGK